MKVVELSILHNIYPELNNFHVMDPIVAVSTSRKRTVHSPGATAAQRALESYKAERESCRAIYSTQHIRSSACGEAAEDRERSRRDRHRAKLALPKTGGREGVNSLTV